MDYFDDPNLCLICFGYHPLKYCKYFKTFTTIQRIYLVNVHRYCPKCFSKVHLLDECTLIDSCSKCDGPHHTMLHQVEEECAAHEPCSPLRQCRSTACGVCETVRYPRLHAEPQYRTFKSFRNEPNVCNTSPYTTMPQRTSDEQRRRTSERRNSCEHICNETEVPSTSRRTRSIRLGSPETSCAFTTSAPSFLAKTPNRQTSQIDRSCDLPFTTTSRWLESVPQFSRENPLHQCCNNQTCPYNSASLKKNIERRGSSNEVGRDFPNTQPIRFSSASPKSESFSELSFGAISKKSPLSPSSEYPLKRSSLQRLSFSTRRSRSPSVELECCGGDREENILSRSAPKTRTNKSATNPKYSNDSTNHFFPEISSDEHKGPLHFPRPSGTLISDTLSIKDDKYQKQRTQPDSCRKSTIMTRSRSRNKTLKSQSTPERTETRSCGDHSTSTSVRIGVKLSKPHHPQLHQIQLYLQKLLSHLKSPKEYWHTPSTRRRQALLRQELSQLKSQLIKLIQAIQCSPNFQTQSSNTCRQQADLKTLFQQILGLLQKCHALSSSRQLNTSIQQLKEHLQHQVDATHNDNGKVLRFQHFLKELQNFEDSCQELERGKRVDMLQQRLGLRIILRQLLKEALEQLTDVLR